MSFTVFYFQRLKTWWRTRRILLKSCMFKKIPLFSRISSGGNVDPRDLTNWNSRQSFGLNFFSRKLSSFSYSPSNSIKIWVEQILQNSCASLSTAFVQTLAGMFVKMTFLLFLYEFNLAEALEEHIHLTVWQKKMNTFIFWRKALCFALPHYSLNLEIFPESYNFYSFWYNLDSSFVVEKRLILLLPASRIHQATSHMCTTG